VALLGGDDVRRPRQEFCFFALLAVVEVHVVA
jgi:hypothetical protein